MPVLCWQVPQFYCADNIWRKIILESKNQDAKKQEPKKGYKRKPRIKERIQNIKTQKVYEIQGPFCAFYLGIYMILSALNIFYGSTVPLFFCSSVLLFICSSVLTLVINSVKILGIQSVSLKYS